MTADISRLMNGYFEENQQKPKQIGKIDSETLVAPERPPGTRFNMGDYIRSLDMR